MKKLILSLALCVVAFGCSQVPKVEPDAAAMTEALKASGLPIGETTVLTSANDPNTLLGRPNQYTSKTLFADTRYPVADPTQAPDNTIEVFTTVEDAVARQTYVETITKAAPMFAQYIYRENKVVLRVQRELLPEQAAAYQAALKIIQQP